MQDELIRIVERALEETGTPGAAIGIVAGGDEDVRAFGTANVRTGLPFTPGCVFPIQSVTKTYTAAAIMKLVEDGRLELDTSVRDCLPGFRVADESVTERVTVRHLLTHTAGWVGDIGMPESDRGDEALERWVREAVPHLAQVVPPGTLWSYSNASYRILGRIIEVLRKEPYETAIRSMLLDPLGMTSSFLFPEEAVTHPIAVGHLVGSVGTPPLVQDRWAPPRVEAAEGGLLSTVEDQLRWVRFWLNDASEDTDHVLSASTRAVMLSRQCDADPSHDGMGLGWPLMRYGDVTVAMHLGSGPGAESVVLFAPGTGFGMVALTNGTNGVQVSRRAMEAAIEAHLGVRRDDPPTEGVPPERLAPYAGDYLLMALGGNYNIHVEPRDGGLLAAFGPPGGEPIMTATMRFTGQDAVLFTEGPYAGARGDFLRDDRGAIFAARLTGRVCPRAEPAQPG